MIRVNPMVLICLFLLSLVGESRQQSDSCSYDGQQVTGEFTIPGFCLLYRCIPGQGLTAIGCDIRIPPNGCYIEHPTTKNYPECCYTRVVCREAKSIKSKQPSQFFDQLNASISQQQNLGYDLPPATFTASTSSSFVPNSGFSTERAQFAFTPPTNAIANFRPRAQQRQRPSNGGFAATQNVFNPQGDKNFGNDPYYYKKR